MPHCDNSPFVLGTVQLGLDYGIANTAGKPSREAAFAVLDAAFDAGVTSLDTAHAYGSSEAVIGDWTEARSRQPVIFTKIPPLNGEGIAAAARALTLSRQRLRAARLSGLMLHRAQDWAAPGVADWLFSQRSEGLAEVVGVSVYAAEEIPDDDRIGLVQLPANVMVQGAARSVAVDRLLARGGRLHVRSVFAQGMLLMPASVIPQALCEARPAVTRFQALAKEAGVEIAALAIACARRLLPSAELVLGAESVAQVQALTAAARAPVETALIDAALALGQSAPPALFDPRHWPKSETPGARTGASTS